MLEEINSSGSNDMRSRGLMSESIVSETHAMLRDNGLCLIRGHQIDKQLFIDWLIRNCRSLTFDPARVTTGKVIQKVDAGVDAIGLHIENGNTPNVPEIIAFWCEHAAEDGSATTVCDGARVYDAFDSTLQDYFTQPLVVTRNIPFALWSTYFTTETQPADDISEALSTQLMHHLNSTNRHWGELLDDKSLRYSLQFEPVLVSKFGNKPSFANALLGPSINYEPPQYCLSSGALVDDSVLQDVRAVADHFTSDNHWQSGDLLVIDNKRVMHGRRAITQPSQRSIFIGMGNQ